MSNWIVPCLSKSMGFQASGFSARKLSLAFWHGLIYLKGSCMCWKGAESPCIQVKLELHPFLVKFVSQVAHSLLKKTMAISHFFLDKLFHPILQIPAIVETCNLDNYQRLWKLGDYYPTFTCCSPLWHQSPSLRRNHSSVDSQQPFKLSIDRFTLKTAGLSTASSWETIGKAHIALVMPSMAGLLMGEVAR